MSEDHIELSQDQIKLVEAFEAAANYFSARIAGDVSMDIGYKLENIADLMEREDFNAEQVNSLIAEEAYRVASNICGEQQNILQSIKDGGVKTDGGYYVMDVFQVSGKGKGKGKGKEILKKTAVQARHSVLTSLYEKVSFSDLPKDFVEKKRSELIFAAPRHLL